MTRDRTGLRLAAAALGRKHGRPSGGDIVRLADEAWRGGAGEIAGQVGALVASFRDDLIHLEPLLDALSRLAADHREEPENPDPAQPRPPAGAGLVIHARNDSADGRRVQAAQRMMRWWRDRGFAVSPVPADGRPHPRGRPCPYCSAAPVPACGHGSGLRYVVGGLCRRCGEDIYRGLGSAAAMRSELAGRGISFAPDSVAAEIAVMLDVSEPAELAGVVVTAPDLPEVPRAELPDHRHQRGRRAAGTLVPPWPAHRAARPVGPRAPGHRHEPGSNYR